MKHKPSASPVRILKCDLESSRQEKDLVAVEEPMEIRILFEQEAEAYEKSVSVTMRTPGNDFELAAGYLFTEGILQSMDQVKMIRHCIDEGKHEHPENIIKVELKSGVKLDLSSLSRNFYMTSSCGICGKASIDQIETSCAFEIDRLLPVVKKEVIHHLPDTLRSEQTVFKHTGGIHAAALFSVSGELLMMREDIGRHNAVDKLLGAAWMDQMVPLSQHIILFSGRASFELVQKSAMAGIPIMAAVGAPSSLAVQTAEKFGMTLCGFVRNGRYNVYSAPDRIV